jgi:hypothetical protein
MPKAEVKPAGRNDEIAFFGCDETGLHIHEQAIHVRRCSRCHFDIPPGTVRLCVIERDATSGRIGTADVDNPQEPV